MAPQQPLSPTLIQRAVYDEVCDRGAQGPESPNAGTGIRLVLNYLHQDWRSDKVARTACGAVQDLLQTDEDCRAALEAGAVAVLTATLVRHSSCLAVMTTGLSSLLRLAAFDRAVVRLERADVLLPLVCAIRQHRADAAVMALSVALLAQLAATRKGRLLLFTTHALDVAIDAMLTHPQDNKVQSLGCELLYQMADGPIAKQRLLAMGAVETVADAVRRFPSDPALLQRALPTLFQLCASDEARIAVGQIGGVNTVLEAVNQNYEDAIVARYGCALLWELTLCAAMREKVVTTQIKALVKKILNHHVPRLGDDERLACKVEEGGVLGVLPMSPTGRRTA